MTAPPHGLVPLRDALVAGTVSSADTVAELLARADRHDPELGVYLSRFDDQARESARALDTDRAAGRPLGPLHGVPVSLKDLIASREGPTTAHSAVPPRWTGGTDATVAARLRAAGAVVLGKVTLAEFGFGAPDPDGGLPVPRNPWDPERWPGGSSSGSASGVAAGLFPGSIGTDTGGSIRIPAALCGVTGFKPTYGSVPVDGVVAGAPSVDTVGPLAATAADCELLWEVAAARRDTAEPLPGAGLRVAVDTSWASRSAALGLTVDPALAGAVDAAADVLASAGAKVDHVALPDTDALELACRVIQGAETFEGHRADLAQHWSAYGPMTRLFIAMGAFRTPEDVARARRLRARASGQAADALRGYDVVIGPTVGMAAPRYGVDLVGLMPLFFTSMWNATGFPAVSVPGPPNAEGLPLGVQIAGVLDTDRRVLAVARLLQSVTDWHTRRPPVAL